MSLTNEQQAANLRLFLLESLRNDETAAGFLEAAGEDGPEAVVRAEALVAEARNSLDTKRQSSVKGQHDTSYSEN